MRLSRFAIFLIVPLLTPATAGAAEDGTLRISDPFPVKLTFDRAGKAAVPATPVKTKEKCTGGGLLGAMNCVTERIEHAGEGDGGSAGSPAEPPISITMSGTVTPKAAAIDDETFRLTLDVAIGPPQFSPSISQIPGDILKNTARDERSVKQALKSWQVVLKKSDLEENPRQEHSFAGAFSGLALFQVLAPSERAVRVSWESAQCDLLQQEYLAAQRAYEEAMSAMPVLDQFELVTRTLDEISETLGVSAEDLKANAGKIGQITDESPAEEKIGELMDETRGLSESLTGALENMQNAIKKEREELLKLSKLGKPLEGVKEGLEKSAETFAKVSEAVADINKKIRMLEGLVETADASPSQQLKAFQEYFEDSRELVGGLVKAIPGLGVFLDLYGQAIGQIAESAERIEAIVDERKKLARELGIPSPYITLGNARERAAREQQKLYENLKALGARLAKSCPGVSMATADYNQFDEMEDAVARGRQACRKRQPDSTTQARVWSDLKAARTAYYKDDPDVLRPLYRREKASYDGKLARYKQLLENPGGFGREEMVDFLNDIKAFYTDKKRISEYERVKVQIMQGGGISRAARAEYRAFLQNDVLADLKNRYNRLQNAAKVKKAYLAAKQAHEDLRARQKSYRDCVREYVRQLAARNGWDQRLVDVLSSY